MEKQFEEKVKEHCTKTSDKCYLLNLSRDRFLDNARNGNLHAHPTGMI